MRHRQILLCFYIVSLKLVEYQGFRKRISCYKIMATLKLKVSRKTPDYKLVLVFPELHIVFLLIDLQTYFIYLGIAVGILKKQVI